VALSSLYSSPKPSTSSTLVLYGDTIYGFDIFRYYSPYSSGSALLLSNNWHTLWRQRSDDPLGDSEQVSLDHDSFIVSIGHPASDRLPRLQFMGSYLLSPAVCHHILQQPDEVETISSTTLLNKLVTSFPIKAIETDKPWFEVDTASDLKLLNETYKSYFPTKKPA